MKIRMCGLFILLSLQVFASDYESIHKNILKPKCIACHNAEYAARGVDLSDYEGVLKTVEPYYPEESLLYKAITRKEGPRMPLNAPALKPQEIREIEYWIYDGAYRD